MSLFRGYDWVKRVLITRTESSSDIWCCNFSWKCDVVDEGYVENVWRVVLVVVVCDGVDESWASYRRETIILSAIIWENRKQSLRNVMFFISYIEISNILSNVFECMTCKTIQFENFWPVKFINWVLSIILLKLCFNIIFGEVTGYLEKHLHNTWECHVYYHSSVHGFNDYLFLFIIYQTLN